jgi:hypothetical protein
VREYSERIARMVRGNGEERMARREWRGENGEERMARREWRGENGEERMVRREWRGENGNGEDALRGR